MVNNCKEAGKAELGVQSKKKFSDENKEITTLSDEKHRLKNKISQCNSNEARQKLQEVRKNVGKKINTKLKAKEEEELDRQMEKLEQIKDDNTRYHYVMRRLHNKKSKTTILVKDEEGNVPGSTAEKIKVIGAYFKSTLAPEDMKEEYLSIPPCEMSNKFTSEEIQKLAKRLNNNKASGSDELHAEFIKHAPLTTFQEIAEIFNITAATGDAPKALTHGLLLPLQKPGKQKGPPENLRPIILLSVLRKILTIALLERTWERLAKKIPKSQAAYQRGRGTTEQVLALKIMIDKALISRDYDVFLLLLDMSKAFDTVNRKTLIQELQNVLQPDELHLLSVLTNRPNLSVFLDGETGEGFDTHVGICQGDCLSAILFIFYLSCALKEDPGEQVHKDLKAFLELFYADDLTYATTAKDHREEIKKETPKKLEKFNLHVNTTKTEEGEAPDRRPPPKPPPPPLEDPKDRILWSELDWLIPPKMPRPDPTYQNIKLLGTKLDTEKDIISRKSKVWIPIKKYKKFFKSKRLSASHKVRIYRTYVEPILLYNAETWTLTSKLETSLNSFHRKLLRIALNYIYPKVISNEKLYTLSQETPISTKIKRRRLNLLGHILRLHPDTPAQRALQYYLAPHPRPVGRPVATWIAQVTKDLTPTLKHHHFRAPLNVNSLDSLKHLAGNRSLWRDEVVRCMGRNSCSI